MRYLTNVLFSELTSASHHCHRPIAGRSILPHVTHSMCWSLRTFPAIHGSEFFLQQFRVIYMSSYFSIHSELRLCFSTIDCFSHKMKLIYNITSDYRETKLPMGYLWGIRGGGAILLYERAQRSSPLFNIIYLYICSSLLLAYYIGKITVI